MERMAREVEILPGVKTNATAREVELASKCAAAEVDAIIQCSVFRRVADVRTSLEKEHEVVARLWPKRLLLLAVEAHNETVQPVFPSTSCPMKPRKTN